MQQSLTNPAVVEDAPRLVSSNAGADNKGLDVIFYLHNITNKTRIKTIVEQVEQQFVRLDVLVNNAAIPYDISQY